MKCFHFLLLGEKKYDPMYANGKMYDVENIDVDLYSEKIYEVWFDWTFYRLCNYILIVKCIIDVIIIYVVDIFYY